MQLRQVEEEPSSAPSPYLPEEEDDVVDGRKAPGKLEDAEDAEDLYGSGRRMRRGRRCVDVDLISSELPELLPSCSPVT